MSRRPGDGSLRDGTFAGNAYLAAAVRLSDYLLANHWTGTVLAGPDPGIRLNAKVGRFLKSYTPVLPWKDDLAYLQAQGYWIFDNWLLYDITGDEAHARLAVRTAESILALQRPEGYWPYPNPEWRGRIATVEGCFAALGLLEGYARTRRSEFLQGAARWHGFMRRDIGFRAQPDPGMLAVNYFAYSSGAGGGVPNNSTLVMWTAARLAELSGDDSYRRECTPMLEWLAQVQRGDGELPYAVGEEETGDRVHFLCYQYNAFEFMDLAHYYRITSDAGAVPVMQRLAAYLVSGLDDGVARYECSRREPEVPYYTTAVAEALSQATDLGMVDARSAAEAAYRHTLDLQRADGAFAFHSRGNYRFLTDRRSYPRYLSIMLHHLLLRAIRKPGGSA